MKLFKGGVLEYQQPGINRSDTLYMDEIPYRLFKKSGIGMFGVKFFKNKQGEQIIVKEIPLDGSEVAQTAYDNIHKLGLMGETNGFIVRILDEGYVYEPTQTREMEAVAYMYAMEPCSGSLSPYVTERPVDTNVINGFLDAFDQLHELGYVHGDIKPDNALLCNGVVKVGDIDTMYPNETSPDWIFTPGYTPFHMLPGFLTHYLNKIKRMPGGSPRSRYKSRYQTRVSPEYNSEYPETYHLLEQNMLNTTIDRWAMGICVYEFVVGVHFQNTIKDPSKLGHLCKRVHNDLCHYYVTGELPQEKAECFRLLDEREYQLDPSMEATMLDIMKEYCLSDEVKRVLDSIIMGNPMAQGMKRQPTQGTARRTARRTGRQPTRGRRTTGLSRKKIIDLKNDIESLSESKQKIETLIQRYNANVEELTDLKRILDDEYQKRATEYEPLLKHYSTTIKEMKQKLKQEIANWGNIRNKIKSETTTNEKALKKFNKEIEKLNKELSTIIVELEQKQQLLQTLEQSSPDTSPSSPSDDDSWFSA